jgi:hypothetical protein
LIQGHKDVGGKPLTLLHEIRTRYYEQEHAWREKTTYYEWASKTQYDALKYCTPRFQAEKPDTCGHDIYPVEENEWNENEGHACSHNSGNSPQQRDR